ncbi:MAG: hypothetical protein J6U64_02220, partial [Alphaproteobacteria bacterium]|nr:hypothetical protein [Alphaproteobacteria bacterium]
ENVSQCCTDEDSVCGNVCCGSGQMCAKKEANKCCPNDASVPYKDADNVWQCCTDEDSVCGNVCCGSGQICANRTANKCCPTEAPIAYEKEPAVWECCTEEKSCGKTCCGTGDTCKDGEQSLCCPTGDEVHYVGGVATCCAGKACGTVCCESDSETPECTNDVDSLCCPTGSIKYLKDEVPTCCTAEKQTSCSALDNEKFDPDICDCVCADGRDRCGELEVCCGEGLKCNTDGICCPSIITEEECHDKGGCYEPDGADGCYVCNMDKVWCGGSGEDEVCCSGDTPYCLNQDNQLCCAAENVDIYQDEANAWQCCTTERPHAVGVWEKEGVKSCCPNKTDNAYWNGSEYDCCPDTVAVCGTVCCGSDKPYCVDPTRGLCSDDAEDFPYPGGVCKAEWEKTCLAKPYHSFDRTTCTCFCTHLTCGEGCCAENECCNTEAGGAACCPSCPTERECHDNKQCRVLNPETGCYECRDTYCGGAGSGQICCSGTNASCALTLDGKENQSGLCCPKKTDWRVDKDGEAHCCSVDTRDRCNAQENHTFNDETCECECTYAECGGFCCPQGEFCTSSEDQLCCPRATDWRAEDENGVKCCSLGDQADCKEIGHTTFDAKTCGCSCTYAICGEGCCPENTFCTNGDIVLCCPNEDDFMAKDKETKEPKCCSQAEKDACTGDYVWDDEYCECTCGLNDDICRGRDIAFPTANINEEKGICECICTVTDEFCEEKDAAYPFLNEEACDCHCGLDSDDCFREDPRYPTLDPADCTCKCTTEVCGSICCGSSTPICSDVDTELCCPTDKRYGVDASGGVSTKSCCPNANDKAYW